ncbi:hypothetical protein Y032_0023g872 [Ancylostoma ceylanicum]|uniref:Uncharacterized protein n=1 Tax=Ancylostoma ceylanicum TaxID=53326 RepID=A0A016V061_9BILA|nr:hypothetical protein Y032_0023g872 [Ancylostoma ceylanicum]
MVLYLFAPITHRCKLKFELLNSSLEELKTPITQNNDTNFSMKFYSGQAYMDKNCRHKCVRTRRCGMDHRYLKIVIDAISTDKYSHFPLRAIKENGAGLSMKYERMSALPIACVDRLNIC